MSPRDRFFCDLLDYMWREAEKRSILNRYVKKLWLAARLGTTGGVKNLLSVKDAWAYDCSANEGLKRDETVIVNIIYSIHYNRRLRAGSLPPVATKEFASWLRGVLEHNSFLCTEELFAIIRDGELVAE